MSMTDTSAKLSWDSLPSLLEKIASFAAITYTFGFIVVNSYYVTFGVIDYQLIAAKYISAGLLFILFHVIIAMLIAVLAYFVNRQKLIIWIIDILLLWFLMFLFAYSVNESKNSILLIVNSVTVVIIGIAFNDLMLG